MSTPSPAVVIIGAGHAGGAAAAFLRQFGFEGQVRVIGEEPVAPYQRPPLSKAWLKGDCDAEALLIKPLPFYAGNGIDLRLNTTAVSLDPRTRSIALSDGSSLAYDHVILATGARARKLNAPGSDLRGLIYLRAIADAEHLKSRLTAGVRLAVIGGGYIGLEAAASARALGADVVVIEAMGRILSRVGSQTLSCFFRDHHREKGVRFELGVGVVGFRGENGQLSAVELNDGRLLACDVALVGIGAIPNDTLARAAGLACDDGVMVDSSARTSDPGIFAIGDVSRRPALFGGRPVRLESVANALEQARQVASVLAGRPVPPPEVTWNWSDQYDLKLQIAGLSADADDTLVRGDPAGGSFAVFHLKGERIRAVEAVNAPGEFMAARRLIASQTPVQRRQLIDTNVSMKDIASGSATMGG